jgi:hypothetical protein
LGTIPLHENKSAKVWTLATGEPLEQVLKERGWTKEAIDDIVKRITEKGFEIPKE